MNGVSVQMKMRSVYNSHARAEQLILGSELLVSSFYIGNEVGRFSYENRICIY